MNPFAQPLPQYPPAEVSFPTGWQGSHPNDRTTTAMYRTRPCVGIHPPASLNGLLRTGNGPSENALLNHQHRSPSPKPKKRNRSPSFSILVHPPSDASHTDTGSATLTIAAITLGILVEPARTTLGWATNDVSISKPPLVINSTTSSGDLNSVT